MNKTNIIIIIICTAIIAAAAYFSLREEPLIRDVYLADSLDPGHGFPRDEDIRHFAGTDSSIYLIIHVSGIEEGERLKTEWIFLEDDGQSIIQTDDIVINDDGSGSIAVYLVKRDGLYAPGDYLVKIGHDGTQQKQLSFSVSGGQAPEP
jgi:hypothetical protein